MSTTIIPTATIKFTVFKFTVDAYYTNGTLYLQACQCTTRNSDNQKNQLHSN